MKSPLKKKDKIDLMPEENGETSDKKADEIVQQARAVATARATGKTQDKKSKAQRRTNEEISDDEKLKLLSKAVDKALADNFAAAVKLASIGLAKLADDKTWIAQDDECQQLAVCVRGYIDLKFPGWGTESPGGALALAGLAFLLPRLAPHKRERMQDNNWAGWFPKLWGWIRPGVKGSDKTAIAQSSWRNKKPE